MRCDSASGLCKAQTDRSVAYQSNCSASDTTKFFDGCQERHTHWLACRRLMAQVLNANSWMLFPTAVLFHRLCPCSLTWEQLLVALAKRYMSRHSARQRLFAAALRLICCRQAFAQAVREGLRPEACGAPVADAADFYYSPLHLCLPSCSHPGTLNVQQSIRHGARTSPGLPRTTRWYLTGKSAGTTCRGSCRRDLRAHSCIRVT